MGGVGAVADAMLACISVSCCSSRSLAPLTCSTSPLQPLGLTRVYMVTMYTIVTVIPIQQKYTASVLLTSHLARHVSAAVWAYHSPSRSYKQQTGLP